MYTEKQQWALEQFDQLVKKTGSQNKACGIVGISAAVVSGLRNENYRGDTGAKFEQLISYFEVKEAAAALPASSIGSVGDYVPTSISSQVYEVIRNCQLKGGLAIACGDAGIGKTRAAKQFVKDHSNDAIYMAANPCLTSLKALLKMLCSKVNISECTIDEMWIALASKLRDGMVIIIDEAQHITLRAQEALRALTDQFADRGQTLGIVFIGNLETVDRIGSVKKAQYAQISNRTRQRKVYNTSNILRRDMQLLFPDIADQPMEIDFLLGIAQSSQAIRGAVNLYSNALDNDNITYDGLYAMAKHMELEIA